MRIIPFLVLFIFLSSLPVYAQDEDPVREDFWISAMAETNRYSVTNIAFGGGASIGYGDGAALGLNVIYCIDLDKLRTLELNFLVRLYLPRLSGHSGFFVQFLCGPALFTPDDDAIEVPSDLGKFSVGLSLGWRFLLGKYFFLEPAIRGGYPYIAGLGLSAGIHY